MSIGICEICGENDWSCNSFNYECNQCGNVALSDSQIRMKELFEEEEESNSEYDEDTDNYDE